MRLKKLKTEANNLLDKYKNENPATYAAGQQAIGGLLILDGFVGIDNPFGGKKRSGIFGSLIGVVLGLAFLFGSSFFVNLTGVNKLTATTTATIASVSQPSSSGSSNSSGGACTPTATYTVDGKSYSQTSTSGSSSACSLTSGQTIEINYDPNNPGAWAYDIAAVKTIFKLFPLIGAVIFVISLVTFVIRLLSIIYGWKLLKSGRQLAKTLPEATDMDTMINEIKQSFSKSLFGNAGTQFAVTAPTAPTAPTGDSRNENNNPPSNPTVS